MPKIAQVGVGIGIRRLYRLRFTAPSEAGPEFTVANDAPIPP
jgi:hypothetical protein